MMKVIPVLVLGVVLVAALVGMRPDRHGPWPKPVLLTHRPTIPTDADILAEELEIGQKNFFTLQEYDLGMGKAGFPRKTQVVHELTAEESAWSKTAAEAESEALRRLLPAMEKALGAPVVAEDREEPRVPRSSLAIMDLLVEGPWTMFQARANLAGVMVYLHRVRRSSRVSDAQRATAAQWFKERREKLAALE